MKSNVYAFGMLVYELLLRKEPYQDEDQGVLPCPRPSLFACVIALHDMSKSSRLVFLQQISSGQVLRCAVSMVLLDLCSTKCMSRHEQRLKPLLC